MNKKFLITTFFLLIAACSVSAVMQNQFDTNYYNDPYYGQQDFYEPGADYQYYHKYYPQYYEYYPQYYGNAYGKDNSGYGNVYRPSYFDYPTHYAGRYYYTDNNYYQPGYDTRRYDSTRYDSTRYDYGYDGNSHYYIHTTYQRYATPIYYSSGGYGRNYGSSYSGLNTRYARGYTQTVYQ